MTDFYLNVHDSASFHANCVIIYTDSVNHDPKTALNNAKGHSGPRNKILPRRYFHFTDFSKRMGKTGIFWREKLLLTYTSDLDMGAILSVQKRAEKVITKGVDLEGIPCGFSHTCIPLKPNPRFSTLLPASCTALSLLAGTWHIEIGTDEVTDIKVSDRHVRWKGLFSSFRGKAGAVLSKDANRVTLAFRIYLPFEYYNGSFGVDEYVYLSGILNNEGWLTIAIATL